MIAASITIACVSLALNGAAMYYARKTSKIMQSIRR